MEDVKLNRILCAFLLLCSPLLLPKLQGQIFYPARGLTITKLNSTHFPENPSGKYRLSCLLEKHTSGLSNEDLKVEVVIDGKSHLMEPSLADPSIYQYDYSLPPNRSTARYYFAAEYKVRGSLGLTKIYRVNTDIDDFKLLNRYIINLAANRAPVGAEVAILGSGFDGRDQVLLGNIKAKTKLYSPYHLAFIVPALDPNTVYPINVSGPSGSLKVAPLLVDISEIKVSPQAVFLEVGKSRTLTFTLKKSNVGGQLHLKALTNIADKIAMGEIYFSTGQTISEVDIFAQSAGEGFILIQCPGFKEVRIPVKIASSQGTIPSQLKPLPPPQAGQANPPPPPPSQQAPVDILNE